MQMDRTYFGLDWISSRVSADERRRTRRFVSVDSFSFRALDLHVEACPPSSILARIAAAHRSFDRGKINRLRL